MEENLEEKRKLGLVACITILVGGMFGSAIFSLSGQTILHSGPAALISWFVAGIILLFYGLIVAELSIIYPKTGGVYLFPSKTIGKTEVTKKGIGFISSWGYLNSCLVGIVFAAIYVGTYLGVVFPLLANMQIPIAIISCIVCGILCVFNISVTGKINLLLVLGLIITSLIYVVLGLFHFNPANLTPFFTQGSQGVSRTFFINSCCNGSFWLYCSNCVYGF